MRGSVRLDFAAVQIGADAQIYEFMSLQVYGFVVLMLLTISNKGFGLFINNVNDGSVFIDYTAVWKMLLLPPYEA